MEKLASVDTAVWPPPLVGGVKSPEYCPKDLLVHGLWVLEILKVNQTMTQKKKLS